MNKTKKTKEVKQTKEVTQITPSKETKVIKAYTMVKTSNTSGLCFELHIQDGIVIKMKQLSRAPDLPISGVTRGAEKLWDSWRNQQLEDLGLQPNEEIKHTS